MRKLIITISMLLASALASANDYKFVSGPQGGNWFLLGGAISSYFTKEGVKTNSSTGGGVSNIITVNDKKADVGFSVGSLLGAAIKGEDKFNQPLQNITLLANLYPQVTYFVARKDFVDRHNIKTLGDALKVKNLRIATLNPGTASEFLISNLLSKSYDIDWRKIRDRGGKVQFTSYSDGSNLIADNNIDLFAFSVGERAAIVLNIESQTDIKILPVEQEAIQNLASSYGTGTYEIKPGFYKSVQENVPTVLDYTVLVARKDLDSDVALKMAQALVKHKSELENTIKDFSSFTPKEAYSNFLPMNPAVKQYFESASQ